MREQRKSVGLVRVRLVTGKCAGGPRARREEILGALNNYEGAVVLVSHDDGAVEALNPERILLLPDGVEDLWGPDYADLVSLA